MEFKHTPAPWVVDARAMSAINSSTKHVALVNYSHHGRDKDVFGDEHKANAHLIAAAPELLEALQSIQQSLAKYIEAANNIGVEVTADGFYLGHAIDVEEKAKQAIAKAIGQQ
ncbi:hypothetical protein [Providencia rettgeri]|uniref:hypothetical protein n=1 Tax=Providencia rettgeri TaxID=587 RepID=UPI00137420C9|nr:hypothetical protein [Providencia rettgeri]BBV03967.1 hypothetical protein BML2531_17430 [Providencia rettgeri]